MTRGCAKRWGWIALAASVAGCGGSVSSLEQELRPSPGVATLHVSGEVVSPQRVDRVTLGAKPGNLEVALPFAAADGTFTGDVPLDAVRQTLTVTAYAGRARVASVSIQVPLVRDTAARVWFRIVDTTCGWPATLPVLALTAFYVSPTAVLVDEPAYVGARALDRPGAAIDYRWTSDCAGTFAASSSPATAWSASAPGTCTLAVEATSPSGRDVHSGVVTVLARTGTVAVDGAFVPWPVVEEVVVASAAGVCDVPRSAADASCRHPVPPGGAVSLAARLRTSPEATFEWRDDCGGAFSASDLSAFPAEVTATWTAPARPGPVVCLLDARVTLLGMVDALPVAVLVAP